MLLRLLVLLAIAAAAPAEVRAEIAPIPFSSAEFERAQAAGKPILVYVCASWCVTCSLQQAAIAVAF